MWASNMNASPFRTMVWNVRGLNNPAQRSAIYQVVSAASPSIIFFQETKMEVVMPEVVAHYLGNKFETFFYLPAMGTRGGILLVWDALVVTISHPHYTNNALTALVKHNSGSEWWLTGVYGAQLDHEKIEFM